MTSEELVAFAERCIEVGKATIAGGADVLPCLLVVDAEDEATVIGIPDAGPSVALTVRELVRLHGAVAFCYFCDSWIKDVETQDAAHRRGADGDHPGRRQEEGLCLSVPYTRDPRSRSWTCCWSSTSSRSATGRRRGRGGRDLGMRRRLSSVAPRGEGGGTR